MIADLLVIVLTFLILLIIDKISSIFGIVICLALTYFCTTYYLRSTVQSHDDYSFDNISYIQQYFLILGRVIQSFIFSSQFSYVILKGKDLFITIFKKIGAFFNGFRNALPKGSDEVTKNCTFVLSHCESSASVDVEIKVFVDRILQSYIQSWYFKISRKKDFINEINYVVEDTLRSFCNGISNINRRQFTSCVIKLYTHYFCHFEDAINEVGCAKDINTLFSKRKEIIQNFKMKHWALKDDLSEWCYLQSVIGTLIDSFGPVELLSCPVLHTVVSEILTQNVMYPLLNVLSDHDRLNLWLFKLIQIICDDDQIISSCTVSAVDSNCEVSSDVSANNSQAVETPVIKEIPNEEQDPDIKFSIQDSFSDNILDISRTSVKFDEVSESSDISAEFSDCASFGIPNMAQQDSPEAIMKNGKDSLFLSVPFKAHSNINLTDSEATETVRNTQLHTESSSISNIKRSRSADFIQIMPHVVHLLPVNLGRYFLNFQDKNSKTFTQSDGYRTNDIELAEEAIEKEVPRLFTDIKITDTEQHAQPGHTPYTIYNIQYTGIFQDANCAENDPSLVKQVVNIKRRFREFIALQSRLEDNPELKNHLKGIKGPSKWLTSPFANLDKKNIAERKSFLESYLKDLCNKDAISKSSELQEFLAYGRDASIAFVSKATDMNVPRIDKMLVKGVKCAIDLLRTALPDSQLDIENDRELGILAPQMLLDEAKSDCKFQEYLVGFSKYESELVQNITSYFRHMDESSSTESIYDDSVSFERKESSFRRHSTDVNLEDGKECNCLEFTLTPEFVDELDTVANAAIDLITEAFPAVKSFPAAQVIELLRFFGNKILNSILEQKLNDITEELCAGLLHLLHEALWPDEQLPQNTLQPTSVILCDYIKQKLWIMQKEVTGQRDEKKINCSILSIIMKFLAVSERIEILLSSVQFQVLNRHLLLHALDLILQFLSSKE